MGKFSKVIALVYILFGLYFINFKLEFVPLDFFGSLEGWIVFIGGVIILIHGLIFLFKRAKRTFQNF
jgi:hypothetical protein